MKPFLITEVVDTGIDDVGDPLEQFDDMSCMSQNLSIADSATTMSGSIVDPKKYFGLKARDDFGARSRWLLKQRKLLSHATDLKSMTGVESSFQEYDSDGTLSDDDSLDGIDIETIARDPSSGTLLLSPRTKYISSCLDNKMNPRMSLIVRKKVTSCLNLQHLGMGDSLGKLLAEVLPELPYVDTINLSDNNLRDKSLGPIITAIKDVPTVTSLDLSNNVLDRDSAAALAAYVHTKGCPLRQLILKHADIDDTECHMFVAALTGNTTLQELDLSSNIIGQTEARNIMQPELITGAEAMAALLMTNTCVLSTLRLGWNMIRLDGGIALADCLASNTTLTYLDMSYNTLGKDGGEHLGSALLSNSTLKTLVLVNNNINFSACLTICVGIEENYTLRTVQMDGNPIGEGGARILMQIPLTAGAELGLNPVCNKACRVMVPHW